MRVDSARADRWSAHHQVGIIEVLLATFLSVVAHVVGFRVLRESSNQEVGGLVRFLLIAYLSLVLIFFSSDVIGLISRCLFYFIFLFYLIG